MTIITSEIFKCFHRQTQHSLVQWGVLRWCHHAPGPTCPKRFKNCKKEESDLHWGQNPLRSVWIRPYLQNRSPQNDLRLLCDVLLWCLVVLDQQCDGGEALSIQIIHILVKHIKNSQVSSGYSVNGAVAVELTSLRFCSGWGNVCRLRSTAQTGRIPVSLGSSSPRSRRPSSAAAEPPVWEELRGTRSAVPGDAPHPAPRGNWGVSDEAERKINHQL